MDKRKEKRIEEIQHAQMSAEEKRVQQINTKKQLEITIPTKEKEIEFMQKMLEDGEIKFKDEQFIDGIMPPYKLEHMIANSKLQLDDMKNMLIEVNKLLEEQEK